MPLVISPVQFFWQRICLLAIETLHCYLDGFVHAVLSKGFIDVHSDILRATVDALELGHLTSLNVTGFLICP